QDLDRAGRDRDLAGVDGAEEFGALLQRRVGCGLARGDGVLGGIHELAWCAGAVAFSHGFSPVQLERSAPVQGELRRRASIKKPPEQCWGGFLWFGASR